MKEFFLCNGIKHITSAPYQPASNQLAERAIQTFKSAIKRSTEGSLETRILCFLFDYRITPTPQKEISPANLLMNRQPKSKLDLVAPKVSQMFKANKNSYVINMPNAEDLIQEIKYWQEVTMTQTYGFKGR